MMKKSVQITQRFSCNAAMLMALSALLVSCGREDDKGSTSKKDMGMADMVMADMKGDPQSCETSDDCTGDAAGWSCVAGTCTDCEPGDLECACFANGTCGAGQLCGDDNICVACEAGVENCPCDGGSCQAGLVCSASDVCVPDSCEPGDLDCPCDGGACNGIDDYCNEMDVCKACSSDIAGCGCDPDGTCQGSNYCDDQTVCQQCPADDKPESCVCQRDSDCAQGLACDDVENTCRPKQTCAELCLPNQLCDESVAGDPLCIPNTCVDGFIWDGTMCVMQGVTTCDGRDGSIDRTMECDSLGKSCVEVGPGSAVCVDTCDVIGETLCAMQHRDCDESELDEDATCGTCKPGYMDDGAGSCVRDTAANCAPLGALGSIASACEMRNQICVPDAVNGAVCGECINDGYTYDPASNACVETVFCGGEVCGADEYCSYPQTGGPPMCVVVPGSCGMNEAYDETTTTCVTCAEMCNDQGAHPVTVNGECVCESDLYCAYQFDGSGDRCIGPSSTCADGEVETPQGQCMACNISCGEEGERNRSWAYTTVDGSCICETQEGYYLPFGGASQPLKCDADGDGWINRTAYETYNVARMQNDQAILANFRCEFRQIDKFTLRNEWGQNRHVSLCENELIDYAPGSPSGCATALTRLTLYEADKLDSEDSITVDNTNFPAYGTRKLKASEVNALTKACVSANGDFNLNGVEDLHEEHALDRNRVSGLVFTSDEAFAFHSLSFFTELHQGRYVAPTNAADAGEYVIAERSRCDTAFPVTYTNTGNYWRNCERSRRGDYDGSMNSYTGFDFAIWGCSDKFDGTCGVQTPVDTGMDLDGDRILDHGLCDQTAPLANEPWRGMNHHSQFQCVILKDSSADENYEVLRSVDLFTEGDVNSGPYEFHACTADACVAGMTGCQESTTQGTLQPEVPGVTCVAQPGDMTSGGQIGWIAARYTPEGSTPSLTRPYLRGCIDESYGTNSVDHYSTLCPGYNENPDAVLTAGNPGDSGKLICACSRYFAGENCEVSCTEMAGASDTSFLHVGGGVDATSLYQNLSPQERVDFACGTDGYCSLVPKEAAEGTRPGFPGGRYGFWMCGATTLTRTLDINGVQTPSLVETPGSPSTGYSLQGNIQLAPVDRKQGIGQDTDSCKPVDPNDPNATINSGYCVY